MSDISIGERIKLIRKNKNLTQGVFGGMLGVSHSHISNIENRRENPSNTLILMICSKFLVEKEWLLYGEGEMYITEIEEKNIDETDQLDELIKLYKKLFNSTNSIVKKENYNKIIKNILSTLVFDSYYYNIDLEEPFKFQYLINYVEILSNIYSMTHKTFTVLNNSNEKDNYKKIFEIRQEYDNRINDVTNGIRKLLSLLCEEKHIQF